MSARRLLFLARDLRLSGDGVEDDDDDDDDDEEEEEEEEERKKGQEDGLLKKKICFCHVHSLLLSHTTTTFVT